MLVSRLLEGAPHSVVTRGILMTACIASALVCLPAQASPFGMTQVVKRARALANKPYQAPPKTPKRYANLNFDQWHDIQYRRKKALWQNRKFHVQFAPAGYLYPYKIRMNVVDSSGVHPVRSAPDLFSYNEKTVGTPISRDMGFAGMRLLYPINKPGKYDEILSFLGASYFRGVAKGNVFGLSARGLAIDTATPQGEEFPIFREFWLKKPPKGARQVTVYALLDSPSIAGAYRFIVNPGKQTVVDVKAVLFPRKKIAKLGIAPLTSMYYYGVGNHKPAGNAFEAAHDSDGLLIHAASGQWIWRPLKNPHGVLDNTFQVKHVKGFGLMQRDRNPKHYAGTGLDYANRPSAWITPEGVWPKGRVELISFHTTGQNVDNVVAFWNPDETIKPGKALHLRYRIHWQGAQPVRSTKGRVIATRIGANQKTGAKKFVIDFAGGPLKHLPAKADIKSELDAGGDKVTENRVEHNSETGGWRLVMQVVPKGKQPNTVRARLMRKGKPVTETWNYLVSGSGQ